MGAYPDEIVLSVMEDNGCPKEYLVPVAANKKRRAGDSVESLALFTLKRMCFRQKFEYIGVELQRCRLFRTRSGPRIACTPMAVGFPE